VDVVSPRRRTTGSSRHRVVDCAESEDVAIVQLVVVDQTVCGHIPQCGLDDPAILVGMLVRVGWVRDAQAVLCVRHTHTECIRIGSTVESVAGGDESG
jgi:hypothetical protein